MDDDSVVPSVADTDTRNRLFDQYRPLVKRLAARLFSKRIDDLAGFDDYMQLGSEGLLEALERFDPARGASFETFATYRIRGAILNGVRISSERNELGSFNARRNRDRVRSLASHRDDGKDADVFDEMVNLTLDLAFGFLLEEGEKERGQLLQHDADPYACNVIAELQEKLASLVKTLPEREQMIVTYHYFQHMQFRHIADLMGISNGRVSQLHGSALRRLRAASGPGHKLDSYI